MEAKFKILDKDGNRIPINMLDEEAAKFWAKEVDPKWYASPGPEEKMYMNWFDRIGRAIEYQGNYTSGWDNIIHELWKDCQNCFFEDGQFLLEIIETETQMDIKFSDEIKIKLLGKYLYEKPYMDLINHWKSKGYQPIKQ